MSDANNPNTPRHALKLMSFGFKYGHPPANYYFDVSFAKNPARQTEWGLFGQIDTSMVDFVLSQPDVAKFIDHVIPLIEHLVTVEALQIVAFGCNAGRHRSPIVADEVARRLIKKNIFVQVEHRNMPEYEAFLYSLSHSTPKTS